MLKIVLTGPESSGKTTLSQQLAQWFDCQWVPEFARSYLDGLERPYVQADLLEIAKGQIAAEERALQPAAGYVFFDTSIEVLKIWSNVRFGNCPAWIDEQCRQRRHDLYLLCLPDLPWQPDPQREDPGNRDFLLEQYRQELKALEAPFFEIGGSGKDRLQNAIAAIYLHLKT
jgi:nicotinamide riboside kinase